MDDYNRSNSKFSTVIIILLILALAGALYYIFKNKNENLKDDEPKKEIEVISNTKKIEFNKKVSGTSGDLYLDKDGKAYIVLSNILSMDNIASLSQEFNVEKNDVYDSDTVKAILVVLPNVVEIGYDDETSNFTLKTKDDVIYNISDTNIRTKSIIYLEEKKQDLPTGNDDSQSGTGSTDVTSDDSKKTETSGSVDSGNTDSSKNGECTCSDKSKGQIVNGVCNKISVSCSGSGMSQRCTPSFRKCQ